MYEYVRLEIEDREENDIRKKRVPIVTGILIVVIIAVLRLNVKAIEVYSRQQNVESEEQAETAEKTEIDDKEDVEQSTQLEQVFRAGEDIPHSADILYDFRGELSDYETICEMLSRESEESYQDGEYTIHNFGSVQIDVGENQNVESVYIEYSNADESVKMQYGIWGINGKSNEEDVLEMLGEPEQKLGNQWLYRFEGLMGMPELNVTLDENNTVTALQYYNRM